MIRATSSRLPHDERRAVDLGEVSEEEGGFGSSNPERRKTKEGPRALELRRRVGDAVKTNRSFIDSQIREPKLHRLVGVVVGEHIGLNLDEDGRVGFVELL